MQSTDAEKVKLLPYASSQNLHSQTETSSSKGQGSFRLLNVFPLKILTQWHRDVLSHPVDLAENDVSAAGQTGLHGPLGGPGGAGLVVRGHHEVAAWIAASAHIGDDLGDDLVVVGASGFVGLADWVLVAYLNN